MQRTLNDYRQDLDGIDVPDDILQEAVKGIDTNFKVAPSQNPARETKSTGSPTLDQARKDLGDVQVPDDILHEAAASLYPGLVPPSATPPEVTNPAPTMLEKVKGAANKVFKEIPQEIHDAGLKAILAMGQSPSIENSDVPALATFKPGGPDIRAPILATAIQLGGIYKGLTGIDLPLTDEAMKGSEKAGVNPAIAQASGEIVGGLGLFLGMGSALRAHAVGDAVLESFAKTPELARVLSGGARAGVEFGGAGGFKEGLRQVTDGKIDPVQFGKTVLKDTAIGVGFGGTAAATAGKFEGAIPDALFQTAGASAYGFGVSAAEGHDLLTNVTSGATAGLYALAGAKDATDAQKLGAFTTAKSNVETAARTEAINRGYSPEQSDTFSDLASEKFTNFVNKIGGENLSIRNWDKVSKDIHKDMAEIFDKGDPIAKVPNTVLLEGLKAESTGQAPIQPKPESPIRPKSGEALKLVPAPEETTNIGGNLFGGPEGVKSFQSDLPLLANSILGRDFPVSEPEAKQALITASNVKNSILKAGGHPDDAQLAALDSFLTVVDHNHQVLRGTTETVSKPLEKQPEQGSGDEVKAAASLIGLEPHELTYDQFKRVYANETKGYPEQLIRMDYKRSIMAAIKEGKDVPESIIQGLKSAPANLSPLDAGAATPTDLREKVASYDAILRNKRADDGMQAAVRDPKTGEVITGPSHSEIIRDAIKNDADSAERITNEILNQTENVGFVDKDYEFMTRRQAEQRFGIMNSDSLPKGGILRQPAYHGSPHKFDKFSLQKIGSGEGHQTFGWGLYFAGKKDVADYYREALSPPAEIPADVRLAFAKLGNLGFGSLKAALYGVRAEPETWKQTWDVKPDRSPAEGQAAAVIDKFLSAPTNKGHLYEVEIPEDGDYLDWDKPLSEQSPAVKEILDKFIFHHFMSSSENVTSKSTGATLYSALERDFEDDPRMVSQFLLSKGIPGLLYLDQGSRGVKSPQYRVTATQKGSPIADETFDTKSAADAYAEGLTAKGYEATRSQKQPEKGTYNYVLFDDSRIKINKVSENPVLDVSNKENGTPIGDVRSATGFKRSEIDVAFKGDPKKSFANQGPREIYQSSFAIKYQRAGNLSIPNQKIYSPQDIAFAFRFLHNEAVEHFMVGAMKDGQIVGVEMVAVGEVDQVSVQFLEAFHLLDKTQADGYFLVHNHPSGNIEPSEEDVNLSRRAAITFDRSGFKYMGHVIIDDTKFSFIDDAGQVRQWEHKEYADTKEIPLLKKYVEWTKSKTENSVVITAPRQVFEIAKGIQKANDDGVVFFMNTQNRVLNAVVIPQSQMTLGNIQVLAARYRGNKIILANSSIPEANLPGFRRELSHSGIDLMDDVLSTRDVTRSAVEQGLFREAAAGYGEDLNLVSDSGTMVAKEKLHDEYAKARQLQGKIPADTTKEFIAERRKGVSDFFKYIGEISSQSLFKIGPELMYRTRRFESDYRQQTRKDMVRAMGTIEGLTKMRQENKTDYLIMDLAMKNGDIGMQSQMAEKYGFLDELEASRVLLNEIRGRIKDAGYEVGYRSGYFPRVIRNSKGLRRYVEAQTALGGEVVEAIKDKEGELGRSLNEDEKANLINSWIRGFVRSKIALSKTGNMKTREIEKVTVDLNKFYFSSREGLIRYIEQANEAVEARKFFGKAEVKPQLDDAAKKTLSEMSDEEKKESALSWNNINDSIGAFVNRLLDAGKITPGQQLELKNIYLSRFGYIGTHGAFGLYKNLEYLSSITNPISGLSQLDDLAASLYLAAWQTPGSFVRALMNKSNITLEELGLEAMAEEIREASLTSSALRKLLHETGFTYFDRVMKECHTNAVMDSIMEKARKGGDANLDRKLVLMFGSEADNVMEDLKAGRKTENVLFMAFNELSDYQPITLLETPRMYQDSPGGRILYQFKTFFLKRLDFLISETKKAGYALPDKTLPLTKKLENGEEVHTYESPKFSKIKALRGFLKLYGLMAIFGMGVDVAKDTILNRKINLSDLVIDNLVKPFGISKYLLYRVRDYGPGEILANFLLPSHKLVDAIYQDIKTEYMGTMVKTGPGKKEPKMLEIPASIPIGGKLWYWWLGRGAQKQRQAQFKADNKAKKGHL